MGLLKNKEEFLEKKTGIIRSVLEYFDQHEKKYSRSVLEHIASAAEYAYGDEILFEEFENWVSNRDDDSFIFLIDHYWRTKKDRNTGSMAELASDIKEKAKQSVASNFSILLQNLCNDKNLKTYKEIGQFLGGLTEERVRILLDGKHKPQRRTILKVAEKFRIDPSELMMKLLQ